MGRDDVDCRLKIWLQCLEMMRPSKNMEYEVPNQNDENEYA